MTNAPFIRRISLREGEVATYQWGEKTPPIILLHGWGDTGLAFSYLAENLAPTYGVVAFDWRGFGNSFSAPGNYYFPDYLADLDAILEDLCPDHPATLIGHSMGANVAGLYAGIRPERVDQLVLIDGFGMADVPPEQAPERFNRWLSQLRVPKLSRERRTADLMQRLRALNPGLSSAQLKDLLRWRTSVAENGSHQLLMDPRHKSINPIGYRRAEAVACWREISARTLLIYGEKSQVTSHESVAEFATELTQAAVDVRAVAGAGHNLHLEAAAVVAEILSDWLWRAT